VRAELATVGVNTAQRPHHSGGRNGAPV